MIYSNLIFIPSQSFSLLKSVVDYITLILLATKCTRVSPIHLIRLEKKNTSLLFISL
jgi:hypothetical protein